VNRSAAAAVALMVFLPQLWIFQGGGWNQNSRFALARALLLRGSVRIDPDADTTRDIAVRGGHVYSDKAPGVSFLAAAALAVVGPLAAAFGIDPDQPFWWRLVPYLVTLLAISLPAALTAAALFSELARRFGAWPALFGVAAVFLASPVLGYAGLLYGHALAGCLLALGWLGLVRKRVALAGFASGCAILVEYTAALGAVALLVYALSDAELRRRVWAGALAAMPPLLLLALYNNTAFGSPWTIGYSSLPRGTYSGMTRGFFGLRGPTLESLWQLSFGAHRGLFRFSPALLLAFPGARFLPRRDAALALGLLLAFFLLNASYAYWDGHASFGPRHAVPGLILLCLPLAAAARRWPRGALVLLVPSLLVCGLAWATRPEAAPIDWDPLRQSWLHFWGKDAIGASIFWFSSRDPLQYRSGFVLPMLLGLDGRLALLPLLPLYAGLLYWFHRAVRT
jgi:hypothetical protein